MKILRLLLILTTACSAPESSRTAPADYTFAAPAYVVLTQKALAYQADFDTEAWADMLADSVQYYPSDGQPPWRGKAAVLAGWKRWQQTAGVQTLRFMGQTHLPIQTARGLADDQPGVYVVSYYTARLGLRNGHQQQYRLSQCCHFNADKRIDICRVLH